METLSSKTGSTAIDTPMVIAVDGLRAERRVEVQARSMAETAEGSPGGIHVAEPRDGQKRRRDRKKHGLVLAAAMVAVAVSALGYIWWVRAHTWVSTDNAYLSGHIHQVSARVSGTVQEVLVEDNQEVRQGEVLARLDPRDLTVKLEQAEAQLNQARAEVARAAAVVAQARSEVTRWKAQAGKAQRDLERAQALAPGSAGVISRQELDTAQAEADAAQASLQAARSAVTSTEALGRAAAAAEAAGIANLSEARLQLSYVEVQAPADGKVTKKNLEVGNWIQAGQPLLALVQPRVWVTANLKETQLGRVRAGQLVRIAVDAFPRRELLGVVDSFSAASGSQFALLPPDNATGNFTRIVQRVPVKIRFQEADLSRLGVLLVPGMSTVVRIRVAGS